MGEPKQQPMWRSMSTLVLTYYLEANKEHVFLSDAPWSGRSIICSDRLLVFLPPLPHDIGPHHPTPGSSATSLREMALWWGPSYSVC